MGLSDHEAYIPHLFSVKDKIVVVTGGTSGLGRDIAEAFVVNGANVIIASRKIPDCESVSKHLTSLGGGWCKWISADLSTFGGIQKLADGIREMNITKLDVLVNNSGTTWGQDFTQHTESGWDKVMDLNLKAPFFLTQQLLPLLEVRTFNSTLSSVAVSRAKIV